MPYGPVFWGWWLFPVMMLIMMVVGLLIMRSFMGWGAHDHSSTMRGDEALDLLKRRYAAGEVTTEQFEEMRRNLGR